MIPSQNYIYIIQFKKYYLIKIPKIQYRNTELKVLGEIVRQYIMHY